MSTVSNAALRPNRTSAEIKTRHSGKCDIFVDLHNRHFCRMVAPVCRPTCTWSSLAAAREPSQVIAALSSVLDMNDMYEVGVEDTRSRGCRDLLGG